MPDKIVKPIAVQYILDAAKLKTTSGLSEHLSRVKKALRGMGWDLTEFGPDIDPDVISSNALSCAGQHAGLLGVTFTGTSARQTAVIGRFGGPVGVWYFPGTPWWSMASAGSGLGYLNDEARASAGMTVSAIWGDPEDELTRERLERFARVAHTPFAMKREKIGLIGGSYYDVMPASNWHPDVLTNRLGPSYVEADISLLEEACERVAPGQVTALVRKLKSSGMNVAEDDESVEVIRASARVALGIERLQEELGLTGVAINCYGGPDPEGYTGVLGRCGASGCLKGHALGSVVIGCESDVVECAQQMMFRNLLGRVPCMADPWMMDDDGVLLSGTCGGPAELAGTPEEVSIEAGTLMSLYKVGVLGVCFPAIAPAKAIVARIHGRELDRMVLATGDFVGSDNTTIPGRLCLKVRLDDPDSFLERGALGNHYTFLPTDWLERDLARIESLCEAMGIEIDCI
jgi:L-fucose isomerase-like protein